MTEPTLRKPLGMIAILAWITGWILIALQLSDVVLTQPWPIQLAFFAIAGTGWILPLKPALRWMETGRWRA